MINYEVEQALNKKADDWKVNGLEQKVDGLKQEIRQLQEKLRDAEGRLQNNYSSMERLIQFMIDSCSFPDDNELYEIKNSL